MSIDDEIRARCDEGRLHLFADAPSERTLYVSEELDKLLGEDATEQWWNVSTDLMHFVENGRLMVRALGCMEDEDIPAFMVRLAGLPEEIWEIRTTDALPQLRLFGRFVRRNVFVALTWSERPGTDFQDEKERCEREWDRLFAGHKPFKGVYPGGYLSNTKIVP